MGPTAPAPSGYPDWDGVPRDELGFRPSFAIDLLAALKERFLEGEGLAEILDWGAAFRVGMTIVHCTARAPAGPITESLFKVVVTR